MSMELIDLRDVTSGNRSRRRDTVRRVESALHRVGYFAVPAESLGVAGHTAVRSCYAHAKSFFALSAVERSELASARTGSDSAPGTACDGLTYLPVGQEPLYNSTARAQRVHSLNALAELSGVEVRSTPFSHHRHS
jgi:isopenicillin N synthase-like dioxygenase